MQHSTKSRGHSGRISIALVLSYVFDWIIIIAAAVVGGLLSLITPNKRPFALTNPEISFPYTNEKISTVVLFICSLVAPAAIIFAITIVLVPGPTVPKSTPKALIWRRKLWEWHTGWLGLALALAASFLITQGMKNLFGKPRPDLLSRCHPDLANSSQYIVGGFPNTQEGFNLFSAAICKNPDKSILDDGFRSFPSGHSSFSAAGLIYLSLFIASKLAITIPYLAPNSYSQDNFQLSAFPLRAKERAPKVNAILESAHSPSEDPFQPSGHNDAIIAARNQAAAPPVYLLVFAIIPWFASIYISSTRYSDFRHHGFDILFGYFIGAVTAIFAFRYYHLPISQGAGWAWGPRSRDRSFWAGVGVGNYVGYKESTMPIGETAGDIELEDGRQKGLVNRNVGVGSSQGAV
ncbi:PAP2 superfamily-domain-containing protein [Cadophora sp. MPI-SDFR-AT-0126]|nr:PAP2 superfamily-domain-containing protein [Leotiomycetes sp. MPI-SDFR-AT-0126]